MELLSCKGCLEPGCWPLQARVIIGADTVSWQDFWQPHRPRRSYVGFGPFEFDRRDYESAIADLEGRIVST